MKLHEREIENISKLKPVERYKYFMRQVAELEELWTLVDKNGDIALSQINDNTFVSFWTNEAFIKSNQKDGWEECVPFKMDINRFGETIIPLIIENNYLINVFSLNGKSGFIVDMDEFARDLNEELDQYE